MPCPLPKRVAKAPKPFVYNPSTTLSSKSSALTYDPAIKKLPDIPNLVLIPPIPIKKSTLGILDKLLLAQAYHNELNALFLKRKVLNDTIHIYQEHIKNLESECASDDDNDDSTDSECFKVIWKCFLPLLSSLFPNLFKNIFLSYLSVSNYMCPFCFSLSVVFFFFFWETTLDYI